MNVNKLAYVKEAKDVFWDIFEIVMLDLIALSEDFTTVPWVLNYVCFMYIAVQLIVANYGLTSIGALI